MEWPKPSSARSRVTMSALVPARMRRQSCTSYQLGSITTTRFTRTRHSDIVHPVSSSQLTEARDRVRSFGGYNTVPAVFFGATKMNNNFTLVDQIVKEVGGTATIFVKSGADYVRVATNVKKDDGSRAIG